MVAVILLFDDANCYCKYQGNVTVIVLRYTGHATLQSVVKSNSQLFLWYNVKDSALEAQNHVNYMWLSTPVARGVRGSYEPPFEN